MKRLSKISTFLALVFLFLQVSCAPNLPSPGGGSSGPAEALEPAFCSTVTTYSGGITATGNAIFYYRPLQITGSTVDGLSGTPTSLGIPNAEIAVYNSSEAIVQCGVTNEDGSFSLSLPAGAASYRIAVFSRSYNNLLKASVLNTIYDNLPYGIAKNFTVAASDTTYNVGTLSAKARLTESANLEGGAFNILYNIYRANRYIRSQGGNSGYVAPKVIAYWKAGFNPTAYTGGGAGSSFYRPGTSKLYILGGDQGSVKNTDTDHFDDYIILHEYGHFLEDMNGKADSPGGQHNGNAILDPRLAWSEGWANFFAVSVISFDQPTRVGLYTDTTGFLTDPSEPGSTGGIIYSYNLTSPAASAVFDSPSGSSSADRPTTTFSGEGTFREISISRTLFKGTMTAVQSAAYGASIPFSAMWGTFINAAGFAGTGAYFKNIGLFNQYLFSGYSATLPTELSDYETKSLADEKQNKNTKDYANPVVVQSASCGNVLMKPRSEIGGISNQFLSNDFYFFYHDGSQTGITLTYSQVSGTPVDLDLILLKDDYVYIEEAAERAGVANSSYAARSKRRYPTIESGSEYISLIGVPVGRYLIDVKANGIDDILSSSNVNYYLTINNATTTQYLCPQY